ncbi:MULTISPECIES: hypothetical protein [unclassified Pseudonocardia]|uniref:hypothetical protein n=1 Tax=unclassified Pseudonocardia TaxID=2619320 RepID=UPI0001FFECEB|nr:hypothetical protein [Pseudonocardia sp. Ae707_Ps1]OLM18774.1 hypothetical protein Ae707Ps1_3033c [Pseudonocardia sp. Ae707_Ps1]
MTGFALTWIVFALVLAMFGARAWVVETNRGRLSTGGAAQRTMTVAVVASVGLLIVMMVANGGGELFQLVLNGQTDITAPAEPIPGQDPAVPVPPGGAPAPPAN